MVVDCIYDWAESKRRLDGNYQYGDRYICVATKEGEAYLMPLQTFDKWAVKQMSCEIIGFSHPELFDELRELEKDHIVIPNNIWPGDSDHRPGSIDTLDGFKRLLKYADFPTEA